MAHLEAERTRSPESSAPWRELASTLYRKPVAASVCAYRTLGAERDLQSMSRVGCSEKTLLMASREFRRRFITTQQAHSGALMADAKAVSAVDEVDLPILDRGDGGLNAMVDISLGI